MLFETLLICDFQTFGGSILANVTWSDIKPLLSVLDAKVTFFSSGIYNLLFYIVLVVVLYSTVILSQKVE